MKFINYSIVTFSIFLTLGIILAKLTFSVSKLPGAILMVCLFILGILWLIARKQLIQNIYFGVITYGSFFLIGFVSCQLSTPDLNKDHYSHSFEQDHNSLTGLKITEIIKSNQFYTKYIAEVISLENQPVSGKIILYLKKEPIPLKFTIDDLLLISATFHTLKPALNPHQFEYSEYLRSLGVYHQIRITESEILKQRSGKPSLRGIAETIRQHILDKVRLYSKSKDEFSIFQALVMGQRNEINEDLYRNYSNAGAIHILAVSGLHVGLIYFMLTMLFNLFKNIPFSNIFIPILIVCCLWGYAAITGLSPSVVRAVTMFSLFAIAKNLHRVTNSFNTLFLSYFILLLIQPLWLFQVGFQLSYLAVFFILWIQPTLYAYYRPRFYLDKLLWGIITVTIAAQLGIIPLSIYYFHTFPGLFMITNIVVLPFLSLLLGGGILMIVLAVSDFLPEFLANSYWSMIELLNAFIEWVSGMDAFIIQNIHFSLGKTMTSYLFLMTAILLWKKFNFQRLILSLSSLSLLIGMFIFDKYEYSKNELVIFHKSRQTFMGIKHSGRFTLYKRELHNSSENDRIIQAYLTANNIKKYSEETLQNVFSYQNKLIMIPDSTDIYPNTNELDIVFLTNNPKLNLDRLIEKIEPKLIIADGANYRSFIQRWKQTSIKRCIPFHDTGKDGAFVLNNESQLP